MTKSPCHFMRCHIILGPLCNVLVRPFFNGTTLLFVYGIHNNSNKNSPKMSIPYTHLMFLHKGNNAKSYYWTRWESYTHIYVDVSECAWVGASMWSKSTSTIQFRFGRSFVRSFVLRASELSSEEQLIRLFISTDNADTHFGILEKLTFKTN